MKNLLVLCILFFAFQNSVSAQGDLGLVIGGGLHNQDIISDMTPSLSTATKFSPQFKFGFSYQHNLKGDKLKLSTGLNFHYLTKTKRQFSSVSITSESIISSGSPLDDVALTPFNSSEITSRDAHFAIAVPLILSVNWKKISIGGGAEYQVRTINPNIGFGYIGNIQFCLSERFSIDANYVRSLTNSNSDSTQSKSRTQRIEASIRYRLSEK